MRKVVRLAAKLLIGTTVAILAAVDDHSYSGGNDIIGL